MKGTLQMGIPRGLHRKQNARNDAYSPHSGDVMFSPYEMAFQRVEVVKNINRFESSIKHKPNVFSVVVQNSNLAEDKSESRDEALEKYKESLRNSVVQFVRNTCDGIVPAHTQLFDVQFT